MSRRPSFSNSVASHASHGSQDRNSAHNADDRMSVASRGSASSGVASRSRRSSIAANDATTPKHGNRSVDAGEEPTSQKSVPPPVDTNLPRTRTASREGSHQGSPLSSAGLMQMRSPMSGTPGSGPGSGGGGGGGSHLGGGGDHSENTETWPYIATAIEIAGPLGVEPEVRSKEQLNLLARFLGELDEFEELPIALRLELANGLGEANLKGGSVLCAMGQDIDVFYVLLQGSLSTFAGHIQSKQHVVQTISPGRTFGAKCLVEDPVTEESEAPVPQWQINIVTATGSLLLTMKASNYHQIMKKYRVVTTMDVLRKPPSLRQPRDNAVLGDLVHHLEFFMKLEDALRLRMIAVLKHLCCSIGEPVFKQGDVGDLYYIIIKGLADVVINLPDGTTKCVRVLKAGDAFGELALVRKDGERTATIRCASDCQFLTMSRSDYNGTLRAVHKADLDARMQFLRDTFPTTRAYGEQSLATLSTYFEKVKYSAGRTVCKAGTPVTHLHVIMQGDAKETVRTELYKQKQKMSNIRDWAGNLLYEVSKSTKLMQEIVVMEHFRHDIIGDMQAFSNNNTWLTDVVASSDLITLMIPKAHFERYLAPEVLNPVRAAAVHKSTSMQSRLDVQLALLKDRGWNTRAGIPLPKVLALMKTKSVGQHVSFKERLAMKQNKKGQKTWLTNLEEDKEAKARASTEPVVATATGAPPEKKPEVEIQSDLPFGFAVHPGEQQRPFEHYFRRRIGDGTHDELGKVPEWMKQQQSLIRQQAPVTKAKRKENKYTGGAQAALRLEDKLNELRWSTDAKMAFMRKIKRYQDERALKQNRRDFPMENHVLAREHMSPDHREAIRQRLAYKHNAVDTVLTRHEEIVADNHAGALARVEETQDRLEHMATIRQERLDRICDETKKSVEERLARAAARKKEVESKSEKEKYLEMKRVWSTQQQTSGPMNSGSPSNRRVSAADKRRSSSFYGGYGGVPPRSASALGGGDGASVNATSVPGLKSAIRAPSAPPLEPLVDHDHDHDHGDGVADDERDDDRSAAQQVYIARDDNSNTADDTPLIDSASALTGNDDATVASDHSSLSHSRSQASASRSQASVSISVSNASHSTSGKRGVRLEKSTRRGQ